MKHATTEELIEEGQHPVSRAPRQRVDLLSEIVRYWWLRRWFIAKVLGTATAIFIVLLLLVPRLYRAEATIMIVPPRFMPEQRPEPLTVGTARSLLGSGELIQQMITRMRQAKTVLDSLGPQNLGAFVSALPELDTDRIVSRYGKVIRQAVGNDDEATTAMAAYLAKLSSPELHALAGMKRDEVDEMTVQDLSEALESEDIVEKKTAVDVRFSPLLKLYAVANDGPKAQLFANTWARLFERMYEQLTVQKTFDQFASIRKQQQYMQRDLEEIQHRIVDFKTTNNLELYQKQIDEYSEDFAEFNRQLTLKENAFQAERGRLAELQRLAQSMEQNETWVGRVDVALKSVDTLTTVSRRSSGSGGSGRKLPVNSTRNSKVTKQPDLTDAKTTVSRQPVLSDARTTVERVRAQVKKASAARNNSESAEQVYNQIREQAIQSRDRLAAAILELNEFYREMPLQLMEKERDQLQKDYLDALSRLRTGQVRLAVLQKGVADLDERLSSTSHVLTLNTGVPNEAIATQAGRGESIQRLAQLKFAREEVNPEWQSLSQGKATLIQEMEILKSEVSNLDSDLPNKEKYLRDLQDNIYRVQLSEQFMKENLERWQRTNQELFDLYVETNNSIASTARQVKLLGVEVQNLENSTSRTKAMVERYQGLYNTAAAELALLEARQRAVQRQSEMLLQKLQDAQDRREFRDQRRFSGCKRRHPLPPLLPAPFRLYAGFRVLCHDSSARRPGSADIWNCSRAFTESDGWNEPRPC